MSEVTKHFNSIADSYDYWKNKNWYYYQNLENILKKIIPFNSRILDYGCGTGDLLNSLKPNFGIGLDISDEMIKIARNKYSTQSNLKFFTLNKIPNETFEYIIMVDLVEHLENIDETFAFIKKFCKKNTKIVILMANPLWEPVLLLLEKLKFKMPEGPHYRITFNRLKEIFTRHNLTLIEHYYRQIIPKNFGKVSDFINKTFYKIPIVNKLGLTEIIILENHFSLLC